VIRFTQAPYFVFVPKFPHCLLSSCLGRIVHQPTRRFVAESLNFCLGGIVPIMLGEMVGWVLFWFDNGGTRGNEHKTAQLGTCMLLC